MCEFGRSACRVGFCVFGVPVVAWGAIIRQPVAVGAWCTPCRITAAAGVLGRGPLDAPPRQGVGRRDTERGAAVEETFRKWDKYLV